MISDQAILDALNEHGIWRDSTRGVARKGMEFLAVIYNGYANHDRSEEYIKNGLELWWNKYGPALGYFTHPEPVVPTVDALYYALETMKKSQQ